MEAPTLGAFRASLRKGNVVPVWREIPADCMTPVMAWLAGARRRPCSFLLESVQGGERFGRYSFVGWDPWRVLTSRGGRVSILENDRAVDSEGGWIDAMRGAFRDLHPVGVPGLPRFTWGAVGHIGYEALGPRREIPPGDPQGRRRGDAGPDLPDVRFGFHDAVIAFDHLRQTLILIVSVLTDREKGSAKAQYDRAQRRLDAMASAVARGLPRNARRAAARGRRARPRSNFTRAAYRAGVERIREYILEGDAYQVVLSQRYRVAMRSDPFEVYRALRRINPSPYMYFLRDGDTAIAGASPEMLVRVVGDRCEAHPIAGTRPRGVDAGEDALREAELKEDPKERAEHVMLVDLARNDLGRVCRAGSVRVTEWMGVERFSHVMHLVSRVEGSLAKGRDAFAALEATFPAGTVSGAPKRRAMEIIDEMEPVPRGPYAGVICYIDHAGSLDSCITIRSLVAQGDRAWVQAGGGIVADSDPGREYEESAAKARAVLAAIEEAT